jgi:hypothetical protein
MNERRTLQARWLEIWRLAGSPRLNTNEYHCPSDPLKFRVIECWAGNNLKSAYYINIKLGEQDVTSLFSQLARYQGKRYKLHIFHSHEMGGFNVNTIMRRFSGQRNYTVQLVINQAIKLHAAAAKAHLDIEAYQATGLPANEIEAKLMAKALRKTCKSGNTKAL